MDCSKTCDVRSCRLVAANPTHPWWYNLSPLRAGPYRSDRGVTPTRGLLSHSTIQKIKPSKKKKSYKINMSVFFTLFLCLQDTSETCEGGDPGHSDRSPVCSQQLPPGVRPTAAGPQQYPRRQQLEVSLVQLNRLFIHLPAAERSRLRQGCGGETARGISCITGPSGQNGHLRRSTTSVGLYCPTDVVEPSPR